MKRKTAVLITFFLCCSITVWAQTDTLATIAFNKDDVQALKTISGLWNWVTGVAATVILVFAFIGLKGYLAKWAEQKALETFARRINVKAEHLEFAMQRIAREFELRSQSNILVVSSESGQRLDLKDFFDKRGFKKYSFKGISDLEVLDTNGLDLILFNYQDKELKDVESQIEPYLRRYIQNTRLLILGKGRLSDKLVKELAKVSFSNDLGTLEQRITEAINRPV